MNIIDLKGQAKASWQRRLLLLTDPPEQARAQARRLVAEARQPLWLGPDGMGAKEARHHLGQEADLLVVDWHQEIALDALGALAGCLVGGGLLVLLSPPLEELAARSPLGQWLAHCLQGYRQHPRASADPVQGLTDDQAQALDAGLRVLTGHRGRPLVLTADRGRGKTATLGLLAAESLKLGRSPVLVTAPRVEALGPFFAFAQQALPGARRDGLSLVSDLGRIDFWAPDALVAKLPEAALLLVDEAAAIPTPLLDRLASHYKRLVLSTTLHGYEGSGRGFALRFLPRLQALYPDSRQYHLKAPVRWAAGCPVEALVNALLLLDAEPDPAPAGPLALHWLDAAQLVARPHWLRATLGLLVSAHYQTAPGDIQHWLSDPAVTFALATCQDKVVGVLALVAEGGLDPALAQAVYLGQRRPKGHLVLQSLASHLGLQAAPCLRAQRVMRIAVSQQGQGLGSWLLEELERQGQGNLLVVSYAADPALLRFWRRAGWRPLRLGHSLDAASGLASVMMGKALDRAGAALLEQGSQRFWETLPWQQGLPAGLINGLYQGAVSPELSDWDKSDLARFTKGAAGLEAVRLALWKLAWGWASDGNCPAPLLAWLTGEVQGPRKAVLAELRALVAQRVP
ncbi:GNAT family N-acetyltransferase [Gallaecimonas xiamenensis]|uniref:tRNA(Met) cytidine acetyltransferase TmcA n=1 Tax=Gallaecimonas xiamenensis 3-C-1 TaxID=745411 RepID=K2JPH9_9GAMM|nr:GNAT family N-acetyltransferase [Gallaecimonas xiamenensis]EKE77118.1 P-loop ATPase fused to an acetyltransferase [Gallaecimonas xiamenensis 3-C-1]